MIELEVVEGAAVGRVFRVNANVAFVGRAPANEVALDDGHVSGRHARIVQGLESSTLEDLGSTNGTTIVRGDERLPLADDDALELRDGDLIELGQDDEICRLAVRLVDDEKQPHLVRIHPVHDGQPLPSDVASLEVLYEVQRGIGRAEDLDAVLGATADAVFELCAHATHVTVVLESQDGLGSDAKKRSAPSFVPVLTRMRSEEQGGPPSGAPEDFIPVTRSVYRKVLKERTAVLAADAPEQFKMTPSLMGASVRSCVAVPLWRGDEIFGVLQVDNRDAPGMLKDEDLDVLLLVAEQASLAIANARLIQRLQHAEEELRQENTFLKEREEERRGGSQAVTIIGESDAMKELLVQLGKVVDTNVTVLIEGDTGTGKELVASALHYRSRRRDKLFVAQNCAALAENLLESELFGHVKGAFTGATDDKKGLFELADGSTLFLDEITEAPMSIQSKLLRALQEGEVRAVGASKPRRVHVRVVAATNRNLEEEVEAGRFREDLYYRLKVFPLQVPSLRERRSDIPLLVQHFLERYAVEIGKPVAGIASEAMNLLVAYDWPGNVRELQNEVQRMVIQADVGAFVTPDLLSSRMRKGEDVVSKAGVRRGSLKETMSAVERYLVYEALRDHDNNKTRTAETLGITREGLHKKLRQFEKG